MHLEWYVPRNQPEDNLFFIATYLSTFIPVDIDVKNMVQILNQIAENKGIQRLA